ncbi:MAG: ParB/RepB/Spo0J family partition protein [Candidatus Acidiferrales bacterium]
MSRNALGKGLSALIREPETPPVPSGIPSAQRAASAAVPALATEIIQQTDVDLIDPSPYQPRIRFREETLAELARSIQTSGIIQPLLVRRVASRFQLIAGERRWRAAQRAGLQRVPVIVRDIPEDVALETTIVENLQREDLNAIEQASAFDRLVNDFHLTQEDVAERTGKDRATIANALRLLKLEPEIQEMIAEGRISAGHGRALLSIADTKFRCALAKRAARGGVTVRHIERLASRPSRPHHPSEDVPLDPNTRAAIEELQRELGTRVTLRLALKGHPGQLMIEYYGEADLMRIYERLIRH